MCQLCHHYQTAKARIVARRPIESMRHLSTKIWETTIADITCLFLIYSSLQFLQEPFFFPAAPTIDCFRFMTFLHLLEG